jgi:hypothetical protein
MFTMEEIVMKMPAQLLVSQHFGVTLAKGFAHGHQETAGSASRVAHDVIRLGFHHLHHEPDNVARGAKLAVLPSAGNLAQHVFVEIALGVAVFHGDFVDHVHDFSQQRARGNGEASALHVLGVV